MRSNSSIAFFLPTRTGSKRVINKNTRKFANFEGGLFELKLSQLTKSSLISEIIISTNDVECVEIAQRFEKLDSRISIVRRPEHLCLDSTNLTDLIEYVPSITDCDHILWGHTTTPMVDASIYDKAILEYLKGLKKDKDSLVSVVKLQNFLLNQQGQVINNTTSIQWPRTQDLEPVFEINHAIFLSNRYNYLTNKNRIGAYPILFEMDKIHSIDVDWEEDFLIAEALYEKFN